MFLPKPNLTGDFTDLKAHKELPFPPSFKIHRYPMHLLREGLALVQVETHFLLQGTYSPTDKLAQSPVQEACSSLNAAKIADCSIYMLWNCIRKCVDLVYCMSEM